MQQFREEKFEGKTEDTVGEIDRHNPQMCLVGQDKRLLRLILLKKHIENIGDGRSKEE